MKYLYKRTGLNQTGLVEATGVCKKMIMRYSEGRTEYIRSGNFGKLAKGCDLTEKQFGYIYASYLMGEYRAYRFELGTEEESEIREPAQAYDPPTPRERAEPLTKLDTLEVPLELAPTLALLRKELVAALEERESAIKEMDTRLLRLVELYERHFEAARDLYKKTKSGRGE